MAVSHSVSSSEKSSTKSSLFTPVRRVSLAFFVWVVSIPTLAVTASPVADFVCLVSFVYLAACFSERFLRPQAVAVEARSVSDLAQAQSQLAAAARTGFFRGVRPDAVELVTCYPQVKLCRSASPIGGFAVDFCGVPGSSSLLNAFGVQLDSSESVPAPASPVDTIPAVALKDMPDEVLVLLRWEEEETVLSYKHTTLEVLDEGTVTLELSDGVSTLVLAMHLSPDVWGSNVD